MTEGVWDGINLTIDVCAEASYPRSVCEADASIADFGAPTPEERHEGVARRQWFLTADEVWRMSTCLRCALPLSYHPAERKRKDSRALCRQARRYALSNLNRRYI